MRMHTETDTEWKNIFQIWKDNCEELPMKVAKSTWSAKAGHFLIVEKVEIKKWPYGSAWGHYYWNGEPDSVASLEKIKAAGVYKWKKLP